MNKKHESGAPCDAQSLLPFSAEELMTIRVSPSEFSRMLDVSRQSVSVWIKQGKLTLGLDGRVDPRKAMKELMRTLDPGRLRARILRQACSDAKETAALAARAAELEQQLADARRLIERYDEAHELAAEKIALEADVIGRLPALDARRRRVRAMLRRACAAAGIERADPSENGCGSS